MTVTNQRNSLVELIHLAIDIKLKSPFSITHEANFSADDLDHDLNDGQYFTSTI